MYCGAMEMMGSVDCAKILKTMADPTRLRVLRHLVPADKTVTELCQELGIEQTLMSHHLGVLRRAKIVMEIKEGRQVYNRICPSFAKVLSESERRMDLGCCAVELRPE